MSVYTCPTCLRSSTLPGDVEHGYCGACHSYAPSLPPCSWCDEPFSPVSRPAPNSPGYLHADCLLRMVVGGLNHQAGYCTCRRPRRSPPRSSDQWWQTRLWSLAWTGHEFASVKRCARFRADLHWRGQ